MEIDQVYKAPSIPKLNRRNIKSTLIGGAIKPGVELKKSKFSFIKPLVKLIPDSLVPIKDDENKGSLVENIQSGVGIQKLLEQSNKILTQIKEQLSLDFLSRINQEKKELAENKKRIAAEKVKDKEKKIESGGRGLLGKTLSAVVAPAKSIFQKLLDFFSIILTGILVNTAFKWLQKPENQEKLKKFFEFLKEYWQELLIVFGAVKLLGLVRKIWKIASAIKGLIDFFKKKPQLPCNCPKSPAQKGGLPDCNPKLLDCVDSLVKDPKKGPGFLESLAENLLTTKAFAPFLLLIRKPPQTAKPQQSQQPTQQPVQKPGQPAQQPAQQPGKPAPSKVPLLKRGALPKSLSNLLDTNQPTAEEKLFKKLNLPSWSIPVVEAVITSVLMSRGRGIGAARIRINPQQYPQPLGPYPRSVQNPLRPLEPVNTTLTAPKISIPNEPVTLKAPKIKVTGTGGKKTIKKTQQNQRLFSNLALKNNDQVVKSIIENPTTAGEFLKFLKQSSSFGRNYSDPSNLRSISDFAKMQNVTEQQLIQSQIKNFRQYLQNQYVVSREKGGSIPYIPGLAGGGTVGGPGRLGVDSVPAMIASGAKTMMGGANALLAPGEEVIRTSSAMLFRPLLKDINDNAGRLWQAFTNAVRKQNLNETIVTDLISQFGKIIEEFKDLLDKEATDIKRKNRSGGATGGGILRPSFGRSNVIEKVDKGVGGLVQDVGGMIGRNRGRQTGLPGGGFIGEQLGRRQANDRYQDFTNSIKSLLNRSRSNVSSPNINIQNPVNLTQNVVNPQIEKTILGDKNIYVIPVPISRESSKLSSSRSSGGNISVINLPPKVVNLSKPSQPKSLPSSPSGTSVPSISPIDESNDYVFTTPSMYGILV